MSGVFSFISVALFLAFLVFLILFIIFAALKKKFKVFLILTICLFVASIASMAVAVATLPSESTRSMQEPDLEVQEDIEPTPSQAEELKKSEYTYEEPFLFDGFEITFHSNVEFTVLDNQFSDLNGAEVIKIPMTVKNVSSETGGLNMFSYSIYGTEGIEQESIASYFDGEVSYAGDLRPGAENETFMAVVYDGDGNYYIDFGYSDTEASVCLPIQK